MYNNISFRGEEMNGYDTKSEEFSDKNEMLDHIAELETKLSHLQKTVNELNSSLMRIAKDLCEYTGSCPPGKYCSLEKRKTLEYNSCDTCWLDYLKGKK